jgi:uncharacterized protein (DUF1499 family)
MNSTTTLFGRATFLAPLGFWLALLAVIAAVAAGLGNRQELWNFHLGFTILKWAFLGAAAALLISIAACIVAWCGGIGRALWWGVPGFLIAAAFVGLMLSYVYTARHVPPIHDISTDTVHPPQFVAILPLRHDAPNSAVYGGPAVAAQQRAAYSDIVPVILPVSPQTMFDAALAQVREAGWILVYANAAQGRIEATAKTRWFGFKDDVVIRIVAVSGGSRFDMRSESRVGRSDLGTNARRVRSFVAKLRQRLKSG